MNKIIKFAALAAFGFAVVLSSGMSSSTAFAAANGEKEFKKCKACHKFGKNALGPDLSGIVGRKVGSLKFKYSKAMKKKGEEGLVWTEENLDKFLKKPKKFIKGTRMAYSGQKKADKRKALIDYLKTK